MPLLLRTVRHSRWLKQLAEPYLFENDLPSDAFGDMATSDSLLSVWEVAEDRSNIERIVRAVAIGRQKIDHMGYVLFDSAVLTRAGIEMRQTRGASADQQANEWHRDLVLSGKTLWALVDGILRDGEPPRQVLKQRLLVLVDEGFQTGELPEKLRPKLQK